MNSFVVSSDSKDGKIQHFDRHHSCSSKIFLDEETNTLYAFQKVSGDSGSQDLGQTEIVQRWWKYMSDIMKTNDNYSPVTVELKEVFYME